MMGTKIARRGGPEWSRLGGKKVGSDLVARCGLERTHLLHEDLGDGDWVGAVGV